MNTNTTLEVTPDRPEYLGYHDHRLLPIKKGMYVKVLKGTTVYSTHPQYRSKEAGRNYVVKVHSVMCGSTVVVGWVDDDGTRSYHGQTQSDLLHHCQNLGIRITGNYDAAIAELYTHAVERVSPWGRKHKELVIHTRNPMVSWAGTGGYWHEADINLVEVVPAPTR